MSVRLGDLTGGDPRRLTDGDWIESKDQDPEGTIRLLQVGNVLPGAMKLGGTHRWVNRETAARLNCTLLKDGDILIARLPDPLGRAARVSELPYEAITAVDCAIFRPDPAVADSDFVVQFMNSDGYFAEVLTHATGTTRKRISRKNLATLGFPLPPLPEQRKIAAILSSVDEAIEATQAVIDQVQVVKKGLMQELLTKGLPGRHKKFKQTEIGQIPEEWEVVELGDVLDRIETGWSPRCDGQSAGPQEWGVLKVSAVSWGHFRQEENKRLVDGLEPRFDAEVQPGDVILSRSNTTELVGRPVLVGETRQRLMLSDKTLRLVPGLQLEKRFLVQTLLGPSSRQQIEDKATGSSKSMKNISQSKLKSIRFPLPNVSEQRDIANVAAVLSRREEEEGRSLRELSRLKQALMSVLLTGELRVRPEATE